jgi:hypothetical protein
MIRIAIIVGAALAGAGLGTTSSNAAVIVWEKASGGNGHAYEFVQGALIGWDESSATARAMTFEGVRGHLATITSAQEQAFIESIPSLDPDFFPDAIGMWLGAFQANPDAPPNEGWAWVTGEEWNFTDWIKGEPDDAFGPESNVAMLVPSAPNSRGSSGTWGDFPGAAFQWFGISGFLVEYDLPMPGDATGDGSVDVDDLVAVVLSWGPCPVGEPCPADFNDSGAVDVDDLIMVILNWG